MEIHEATERLHDHLKRTNRRYSIERDRLIEAVYSLPESFSQQDLLEHIREYKNVHALSTLYRNLSLLVDSGILTEYRNPAGRASYRRGNHGVVLVCTRCDATVSVEVDDAQLRFEDAVAKRNNYVLLVTHRVIRGLCPECASAIESGEEFKFKTIKVDGE